MNKRFNKIMRKWWLLFVLLIVAQCTHAQNGTITGKVMSADIQIPLAKASVFLSNATFGTATQNDGSFTLANVKPGQYELVVSYVGYDSYHKTIMVNGGTINLDIEMHLKSTTLDVVNITVHKFSKENFAMFVKYFIGTSANSAKCRIMNPKSIDLYYNKLDKVLVGHSDDFIIIENRALGYRLKYLLNSFKYDGIKEIISYGGQPLYQDMKGSRSQLAIWRKAREDAYYGSSMHFYRSLITNMVDSNGFRIYHLNRRPNPERPPQITLIKKMDKYEAEGNIDSLNHWRELYQLHRYIETLDWRPIGTSEISGTTREPGVYGIAFPDCLYVVYTKKLDEVRDDELYRPLNMPNYMVTILTLNAKVAFFDSNGVVFSNDTPLYEGSWARNKIAELLPVDYAPDDNPTGVHKK